MTLSRRRANRLDLARWAVMALAVGIAQLFRSPVEVFLGAGFVVAGVVLVFAVLRPLAIVVFVGFGLLAVIACSRAVSAPFIPRSSASGVTIVIAAWALGIGWTAARHAIDAKRMLERGIEP